MSTALNSPLNSPLREIVLDTETTGLDPEKGDRVIEIGCVELINHLPTGRVFHEYINPEREIDAAAIAVHGIKNEFLKNKPIFVQIASSFMEFIQGATLVIHNAEFDIKFLNAELSRIGSPPLKLKDAIDTVHIARRKFPGAPANLNALCRRFDIDLSGRELHGALLDAQLLADVYLELLGGRQHGLGFSVDSDSGRVSALSQVNMTIEASRKPYRPPREFAIPVEESESHSQMLKKLKGNLWD